MNGKIGVSDKDLQKGDVVCPKCEGLGTEFMGDKDFKIPCLCHVCGGDGKLDWLERLFGKQISQPTPIVFNDKRSVK